MVGQIVRPDVSVWPGPSLGTEPSVGDVTIPPVEELACEVVAGVHEILAAYRSGEILEETALARLRKVGQR